MTSLPRPRLRDGGALTVFLVEHDEAVRDALTIVLEIAGASVAAFATTVQFLEAYPHDRRGCLVVEIDMPEIDGIQLIRLLVERDAALPTVAMTTRLRSRNLNEQLPDVVLLLEKPFGNDQLLTLVARAASAHDLPS
jgi:two-component system, LuxR family, response regulator FixJ